MTSTNYMILVSDTPTSFPCRSPLLFPVITTAPITAPPPTTPLTNLSSCMIRLTFLLRHLRLKLIVIFRILFVDIVTNRVADFCYFTRLRLLTCVTQISVISMKCQNENYAFIRLWLKIKVPVPPPYNLILKIRNNRPTFSNLSWLLHQQWSDYICYRFKCQ